MTTLNSLGSPEPTLFAIYVCVFMVWTFIVEPMTSNYRECGTIFLCVERGDHLGGDDA